MQHYTCSFANAILSGRCGCKFAAKDCVAEKEFATCLNKNSAQSCNQLYDYLKENSNFAIKSILQNNLTVAQQNKIRIGGIKALNFLINSSYEVVDIDNLRQQLLQKYQQFNNIPLTTIIPQIAQFKIRGNNS